MPLTNKYNLPEPIVAAVARDYKPTPKRYSVTTVLKGTREIILSRRHRDEVTTDVADYAWAIFGTAVHGLLEKSQETDTQLKENFISTELPNGYTVSGVFDLYDDSNGTVTDYKTVSVWKVIKGEWGDYKTQLLCYCWMLRSMGFDAHRGEIVAFIKDHSKTKAKLEADYPEHPIYVTGWDFTEDDFAYIGDWLEAKFREIEACEKLPDEALPICSPTERWYEGDSWAVIKKGNKKATKVMSDREAAEYYADCLEDAGKGKYEVQFRPGKDKKCLEYCSVAELCSHWKEKYGADGISAGSAE